MVNANPGPVCRSVFKRQGREGCILLAVLLLPVCGFSQSFGTNFTRAFINAASSSPAIGLDGSIYLGGIDTKLHAVRPGSTQIWAAEISGVVSASPTVGFDGTIYVGSVNKDFYAISPSGQQLWSYSAGGAIYSSAALAADGHLFFGSDNGKLHALNRNGTLQWVFPTGNSVRSSPAIGADGTIYFGSYDGKIYALQPNGVKKWSFNTHSAINGSPAIGPDERIYIGCSRNLYAFTPEGTNLWTFNTAGILRGSPAIGPDGTIYFGSDDSKVYALNSDGTKRWEFVTGAAVHATPALAADGTLFVGSLDRLFYALNGANGSLVWQFATSNQISSSAVISLDSTVCFASTDRYLYQLRTTNVLAASCWPMFGRNLRHTASGFVKRVLPSTYSAGGVMIVVLEATPPPGTAVYEVEDQPPLNWTVGEISDNGLFDVSNLQVKFGPFFDDTPRTLSYVVTSPLSQSGEVQFSGSSWADAWNNAIGGDATTQFIPAHPADLNPVQGRITINDLTSYGAAWKQGAFWPVDPNPIPLDYVTRAASLWQGGEYYQYDPSIFAAPAWWVNTQIIAPPLDTNTVVPIYPSGTDGSTALVQMARQYQHDVLLTVQLSVTPDPNRIVYAVEDLPPAGWAVTHISSSGRLDTVLHKVKWGPFFDNLPRTFSYDAVPPAAAAGPVEFQGLVSLDGTNLVFYGQRFATDSPVIPSLSSVSPQPDGSIQLELNAEIGFYYVIEASSDLIDWEPITSFFSEAPVTVVIDPDASRYPQRFYRAVLP